MATKSFLDPYTEEQLAARRAGTLRQTGELGSINPLRPYMPTAENYRQIINTDMPVSNAFFGAPKPTPVAPVTPARPVSTTPQAVPVTQRTSTVSQGAPKPVGVTAKFRQPSGAVVTPVVPNQQYLTAQGEALTNQEFQSTFGAPQPVTPAPIATPAPVPVEVAGPPIPSGPQFLTSEGVANLPSQEGYATGRLGFKPGEEVAAMEGGRTTYIGGARTATYDPATGKTTMTTIPGTRAVYGTTFAENQAAVTQEGINRFAQERIAREKAAAENLYNISKAAQAKAEAEVGIPAQARAQLMSAGAAQTSAGASALSARTTAESTLSKKEQIALQGELNRQKTITDKVGVILAKPELTEVQKQSAIAQLTTKPGEVYVPGTEGVKGTKGFLGFGKKAATPPTAGYNKPVARPTYEQFLPAARKANPKASEESLKAYYSKTYGG